MLWQVVQKGALHALKKPTTLRWRGNSFKIAISSAYSSKALAFSRSLRHARHAETSAAS
jgi:hypothetical protein